MHTEKRKGAAGVALRRCNRIKTMAKGWSKPFYNSRRWKQCRDAYVQMRISIDGGICEECGENMGYIVHHNLLLTPENIRKPEVALNYKHMKYVCKACHDRYEGHGVGHKRTEVLCIFDEQGQPISLREIDTPPFSKKSEKIKEDRPPRLIEYTGRA